MFETTNQAVLLFGMNRNEPSILEVFTPDFPRQLRLHARPQRPWDPRGRFDAGLSEWSIGHVTWTGTDMGMGQNPGT